MAWPQNPFAYPAALLAVFAILLARYVWKRRAMPGAFQLSFLMAAVATWTAFYTLELASPSLPGKIIWLKAQYLGVVSLPLVWAVFALYYTHRDAWVSWRNLLIAATMPAASFLLALTNERHGLIWETITLTNVFGYPWLEATQGFWADFVTVYSYFAFLTGTVLILQAHIRAPKIYRQQTAVILAGALVPWLFHTINQSGFSPYPNLDLLPFAFVASGGLLALGLFRFRLFDMVPVAHSMVLESMLEGVLVLDEQRRVININPAAALALQVDQETIIGSSIQQVFATHPGFLDLLQHPSPVAEFSIERASGKKIFEVERSRLHNQAGQESGSLFVLRDITLQKNTLGALRDSEEYFRLLTEAITEGVVFSENGIITGANHQYAVMFGFEDHRDELVGKAIVEMVAPADRDLVQEYLRQGYSDTYRVTGLHRSGRYFPLEVHGKTVYRNGRAVRITALKDITLQLDTEERIRRREAILQAVSFITQRFLASSSLDATLPEALRTLGQATQSSRAYVFRNRVHRGEILTSQIHEWTSPGTQPQLDNAALQDFSFRQNQMERWETTLQNRLPVYGAVREFPPSEQAILDAQEIQSLMVFPIHLENTWWGFIGFDDCEKERNWEAVEIHALETAAGTIGSAIQRQATEETLRRRADELKVLHNLSLEITATNNLPELLEDIVEQAQRLLGGTAGGLYLANPADDTVTCVVSLNTSRDFTGTVLKYGEGAAGYVAQTKQPLIIDDYRKWSGRAGVYEDDQPFRSLISAPLIWQGDMIGVIHVLQNEHENFFNTENVELLTLFANQAVIAIQNAKLYAAERRRVDELHALQDTLTDLSGELDLPRLLKSILERAVSLLGATGGDLGLYEAETNNIRIVVSHNMDRDYTGTFMTPGEGAMGKAIEDLQPVVVADYQVWEGRSVQYQAGPWHAALAVPLILGSRLLGTIGVVQADAERKFNADDIDLFNSFAQQAAIAIDNAHMFRGMQAHARHVALLNDITRAAISAASLDEMLQQLGRRLKELFAADDVFITLWDPELHRPIPLAAHGKMAGIYPTMSAEPGETTMTRAVLESESVLVSEDVTQTSFVSPRIAAMFSTRAVLGLPLIADGRRLGAVLVSYNQPRRFSREDTLLGERVGAQVALAVAKMQALDDEKQRAAELAEANSIILALGHVAARFEATPSPDQIMKTLGDELNKLGMACLVALQAPDGSGLAIRYISLQSHLIELAERLAKIKLDDYRILPDHFPFYEQVYLQRQACISSDTQSVLEVALPVMHTSIVRRFSAMYGLTPRTRWMFLPLISGEKVIGSLWMWGEKVRDLALPAASIFASQVAVAIENARLYNEIQQLAITDELTGLYNRRGLFELGQREVDRSLRYNRQLTAIMLDIDHFKRINDQYGHPVGDEVLAGLAQIINKSVRDIDIVGRYGGEEFLILLPESEIRNSTQIAERLRQRVAENSFATHVGALKITASLGLSELTGNTRDLNALVARSDQALYSAKQSGRNRVMVR